MIYANIPSRHILNFNRAFHTARNVVLKPSLTPGNGLAPLFTNIYYVIMTNFAVPN